MLVIYAFDSRVRPVLTILAQANAKNAVSRIVNDTVANTLSERAVAYQDIISLEKGNSGQITALTSNTTEMNRLRTEILSAVLAQIEELDSGELGVSLGELTGLVILSEKGPVLPVRVRSVGTAAAEFHSVFTSAGINQTYHQVMLDFSVDVTLLIPGGAIDAAVSTQVCVAETVLVGEVPQTFLQLSP